MDRIEVWCKKRLPVNGLDPNSGYGPIEKYGISSDHGDYKFRADFHTPEEAAYILAKIDQDTPNSLITVALAVEPAYVISKADNNWEPRAFYYVWVTIVGTGEKLRYDLGDMFEFISQSFVGSTGKLSFDTNTKLWTWKPDDGFDPSYPAPLPSPVYAGSNGDAPPAYPPPPPPPPLTADDLLTFAKKYPGMTVPQS